MKKLYAFAAAALAAFSMNAQVYLCGNWDNDLGWDPANPKELTKNDDGNWEITLHMQSFKISTAKGDWDTFNAGALSTNEGTITEEMVGKPQDLEAWGENTNLPWEGDWTITVSADYKTLTCTTTTEKPVGFPDVSVVGAMTDNWAFLPDWMMSTEDGITYTFTCSGATIVPKENEFKISTSNWTGINYSTEGEAIADGDVNYGKYNAGGNMYFVEDFEGEIKLVLVNGQMKEAEIYFTPNAGVDAVAVENNAAVEYFNLQGVRVANPENGLYIRRQGATVSKVLVK